MLRSVYSTGDSLGYFPLQRREGRSGEKEGAASGGIRAEKLIWT